MRRNSRQRRRAIVAHERTRDTALDHPGTNRSRSPASIDEREPALEDGYRNFPQDFGDFATSAWRKHEVT